ncbi:MAG: caspase family protein [Methylococcales bacterium]
MKKILVCNFYSIILLLCLNGLPSSVAASGRIALVIGNSDYENRALENSLHDAEDIAAQLKHLGFEVLTLNNGSQQQMEAIIGRFSQRLSNQDAGLFYYAGHGVQANGINYLIPVKSDIRSLSDLRYKAVDSQYVFDKMADAHIKTSIFILDACRDNPFHGMRGGSRGLANMSGPNGAIIAFATSPGSIAADGTGRNGLYTQYLLQHMTTPGISIEQVFKRVRIDVDHASQGEQIPWENSSLRQDFCFVNCAPTTNYVESTKLDAVKQEKEQLARELTQIKTVFESKQEQLQAFEKLRQEKTKLEQALSSLQQAYNTHQQNTRNLKKLQQQEEGIETALKNKQQTEVEKERLVFEKDKLLQDKAALTGQISRYEANQQQQLDKLNQLQQENSRLTTALKQEQAAVSKPQTPEKTAAIRAQLDDLEAIKREKEALQTRLENQVKASQSLQEKLKTFEQLQQEKSQLEQRLALLQRAQQVNVQNELQLKRLKQQESVIEQALKNKLQSETEKGQLITEKAKLLQDKDTLESQIASYKVDQQQQLDTLKQLQQENVALQIELQTRQEEHASSGNSVAAIPMIGGF